MRHANKMQEAETMQRCSKQGEGRELGRVDG